MATPHTPLRFFTWFSALVLASLAVHAAEAPATNTALIPVPQTPADGGIPQTQADTFMQRHQGFVAQAKQGGIDVLFVGDSITQGWPSTGKAVWDYYYAKDPKVKFAEFGIGYDRTQHVLWRLQNGEVQPALKPKVVELMIGTNNIGRNTNAETADGVKGVVTELRKDFPDAKILLLGIFPRGAATSANRRNVNEINATIAKLDDGQHVYFMDIGAKFLDAQGNFLPGLMGDAEPLHPALPGYQVWVDATTPKLQELLKLQGVDYTPTAGKPTLPAPRVAPPAGPTADELTTLNQGLKTLLSTDPAVKAIFAKYPNYNPFPARGVNRGATP